MKTRTYTNKTLPISIGKQVLNLYNLFFPSPRPGTRLRQTTRFVFLDGEKLISHAAVIEKTIHHRGQSYKLIGLGGVLTHPQYQRRGYGTQIVKRATEYIRSQKADVAVLFCDKKNINLYRRSGWEVFSNPRITVGKNKKNAHPQEEMTMILYLSSKAKANKEILKEYPMFFGESW